MEQYNELLINIEQLKNIINQLNKKKLNDIDNLLLQHINAKLKEFKERMMMMKL